ncbi:WXG100 family type VII secretion target [Zhihengliuella salsuginis]|uniref:WXG100 family type VII secretion target n=1 Tax=Zhihengliuella salsuginis TaxID=578222 RepID=A0ABQ3GJT9_9MICC|nr:hypothetical protein [Zhihengliuella salsuginis]GHD06766.1 hypothetical protein GCM10008096_17110 [Zhihengliuella salsuginis]
MKFDMGASTLSTLNQQTAGSNDELGSLVRQLVDAVTPLQGKFNGAGRAAFDNFKARADEISADLNQSLAKIAEGQQAMHVATQTGDQEAADNASRSQGAANFDAARFSGGGGGGSDASASVINPSEPASTLPASVNINR